MKIIHVDKNHPILIKLLSKFGYENFKYYNSTKIEIEKIIENYDGIIIRSRFKIDKSFIKKAKRLKFIARVGSGKENIDVDYAKRNNIKIFTSPEGNSNAVGEHALGLLLSLINKIIPSNQSVKQFKWLREKYRGYELENKIIGIIGYGHTGKSFAKKLSGFNNIKVLFYDIKEIKTDEYAEKSSLEKIFKNADIISFHVDENDLSIKMFNKSFIKKMRKPFWIINTSRGKVVSLEDLKWGIEKNIIFGAGLDVIELEDYSFEKVTFEKNKILNFFLKSEKVIITPHIAGWTYESHHKLAKTIVNKISKYF
ncbi:MAG: NAD(P)-dependent oxidoreductase [Bacteroidota bacterium]|nr:NAD(P)-dependent oxidoreductase [Bacteroidota bacterium]